MKKRLKVNRTAAEFAVIFGLLCAIFTSFSRFNAVCDDLRSNVLRMHIIANSDSEEDQNLKLKIRDRILSETSLIFDRDTDLNEAVKITKDKLPELEATANEVIKENGFNYTATVSVGDSYFETREYEDFTLPAGTYRSLIIRLGKAEGKNWWCVIFPGVCLPSASDSHLSDTVRDESAKVAEHPQKYVMRFKTVEIYEDLKKIIKK